MTDTNSPSTSSQALRDSRGAVPSKAEARQLGVIVDRSVRWERRRRIATVVLGVPVTALLGWAAFFATDGVGGPTREGTLHGAIYFTVVALGIRLVSGVLHRAVLDAAAVTHGVDRQLLAAAVAYAARHRAPGERAILEVAVARAAEPGSAVRHDPTPTGR